MKKNEKHLIFEAETMSYVNDLYRTARRLLSNQNDAEDLVQETFLQAWKSFDNYEIGTNCRAWLYRIMFNKYHHFRRKRYTQAKHTREGSDLIFENAAFTPPVPEHLTDQEVIEALNKLPDHYREVSLLVDVHDFSYKEASAILDIPIGTVMSRLYRSRHHLKTLLINLAGDYGISSTLKMAGQNLFLKFSSFVFLNL